MFVPQIVGGDAVPVPPLLILNVSVLKWKIFSSLGCYQCLIYIDIYRNALYYRVAVFSLTGIVFGR